MKKVIFLCSLILLLSCSESDENDNATKSDFHPPAWILGNWVLEDSNNTDSVLFSFSTNDFCMTTFGIAKQCQQELVNQMKKNGGKGIVTEIITPSTYTATIEIISGQTVIYSFKKLSNISMEWTSSPGAVYVKK